MKKFAKIVNITATAISAVTLIALVLLVAIFSSSKDVEVEETVITVEQIKITRRKVNDNVSFCAENVNQNAQYYLVIAFDLYEIENQNIYLTIKDSDIVYLISVNEKQEASIVYN